MDAWHWRLAILWSRVSICICRSTGTSGHVSDRLTSELIIECPVTSCGIECDDVTSSEGMVTLSEGMWHRVRVCDIEWGYVTLSKGMWHWVRVCDIEWGYVTLSEVVTWLGAVQWILSCREGEIVDNAFSSYQTDGAFEEHAVGEEMFQKHLDSKPNGTVLLGIVDALPRSLKQDLAILIILRLVLWAMIAPLYRTRA